MSEVKIKKAKIKDGLFLEVEFSENLPGHTKKETKLSCTVPIHADMKTAFANLPKHLILLCEELEIPAKVKKIEDWENEKIEKFSVQGFSIGGSDEHEGVTLSGRKEVIYGAVNLNSPFQKWGSEEYKFMSELSDDVENCIYEVEQYLFHGKRAPEKQLALEMPEGSDDQVNTFSEPGL